jgi:hypothetical protein
MHPSPSPLSHVHAILPARILPSAEVYLNLLARCLLGVVLERVRGVGAERILCSVAVLFSTLGGAAALLVDVV